MTMDYAHILSPCGSVPNNEDPDFQFVWFRVALVHNMFFIFTVYWPQDDGIVMFDKKAVKVNEIVFDHPSANVHICADFNIHFTDPLKKKTDGEGR